MADDESHQRSHPESPADRREREIIRTERSILARLARAIKSPTSWRS